MKRFQKQVDQDNTKGPLSLDKVLNIFANDLEKRGLLQKYGKNSVERIANALSPHPPDRLKFALTILETYIKMPNPITSSTLPVNYCALPRLMPWTAPFFTPICP